MNLEEILEYNRRCAEYLGAKFYNDDPGEFPEGYWIIENCDFDLSFRVENMEFDTDWNLIMAIVDVIDEESFVYHVEIETPTIYILANMNTEFNPKGFEDIQIDIYQMTKKEAVVEAINQFLIWRENNYKQES
jgi:hypothetical protein